MYLNLLHIATDIFWTDINVTSLDSLQTRDHSEAKSLPQSKLENIWIHDKPCSYRERRYKKDQDRNEKHWVSVLDHIQKIYSIFRWCLSCVCMPVWCWIFHISDPLSTTKSCICLHCILNCGYLKTSANNTNCPHGYTTHDIWNKVIKCLCTVSCCTSRNIQIWCYFSPNSALWQYWQQRASQILV